MDSEGHCKIIDFGNSQAMVQTPFKSGIGEDNFLVDYEKLGQMTYQMFTGVYMTYFGDKRAYLRVRDDLKEKKFQMSQVVSEFIMKLLDTLRIDLRLTGIDPKLADPITKSFDPFLFFEPFFENNYLIIDNPIKNDPFFENFDWKSLENGSLKPPFKPATSTVINHDKFNLKNNEIKLLIDSNNKFEYNKQFE